MKRLNIKVITGLVLEFFGVIAFVVGFCIEPTNDNIALIFVNLCFFLIGSLFIFLSIKINPERLYRVLREDDEDFEEESSKKTLVHYYVMDDDTLIPLNSNKKGWDDCYLIAFMQEKNR